MKTLPFAPDTKRARNDDEARGILAESALMNFLAEKFNVEKSSKREDIRGDKDFYLDGKSVSAKAQDMAARTGNLAFELEVYNQFKNAWEKSHYHKLKDLYVCTVLNTVYVIDCLRLKEYINENGWQRITQLSSSTKSKQVSINHAHINARLGLFSITELTRLGLCSKLGEFDAVEYLPEEYKAEYRRIYKGLSKPTKKAPVKKKAA